MNLFRFNCCNILKSSFSLNFSIRSLVTQQQRPPSYLHTIGKEPFVYRSVGQQLALTSEKYGDRDAVVSCLENKRYTFAEVLNKADHLAAGLLKIGLKIGDRVAIWAPNSSNWYITMMAVARAGLVLVTINTAYQIPEMVNCLNTVNLNAIVTVDSFKTQNFYKLLNQSIVEMNSNSNKLSTIIIDSEQKLPGTFNFEDVLSIASELEVQNIENISNKINPDDTFIIQFTSGTTGQPKATSISHFSVINNSILFGNRMKLYTTAHKICMPNPLYHSYANLLAIPPALVYGASLVLPGQSFSAAEVLQAIIAEKCTIIYGTPTMYVDMITKQKELQLPIATVEIALTGGAPCSPKLFSDIRNILSINKIKSVCGMTETIATFLSLFEETKNHVIETVGHVMDHIEVKVINPNGEVVPMGTPGELCVRGYSTMLGYINEEAETKKTIGSDNWLRTGDQFILREDGYGQIVGRYKDMIIRGGVNIYPKEIEDLINTHPHIIETHVFGVPDDRLGEEVCAYIRTNDNGTALSQKAIKEFCKHNLAYFKIPRYVKVVKSFPKTGSGKIQKFKLREQFINDL